MRHKRDFTGQRFGRWTVLGWHAGGKKPTWHCRCDCNVERTVTADSLVSGRSASCGCLRRERVHLASAARVTHHRSETAEYGIWRTMKARCALPSQDSYQFYGGRGIRVCDRWTHSFAAFYEDMGPRPSRRHSLDRIDGNGDYEPGNVRWATGKEQGRHRSDNHHLTHDGVTKTLAEWSESTGIKHTTILARLRSGWNVGRALAEHVHHR